MEPVIEAFFDPATYTVSYLLRDPASRDAAIIDPVLDFDARSGRTATRSADRILDAVRRDGLSAKWILETHAHADHLSAAAYLKQQTGAPIGIGEHIAQVQKTFRTVFHATDVMPDGTPFDRLFHDGESFAVGALRVEVIHTPGHTPACVSYRVGGNVFVGDTLFMPDYGTARADFPGGDAHELFRSTRRLLSLPGETVLWMCHDYGAPDRQGFAWRTTVAEQRARNIHVHDGVLEEDFVKLRHARDRTLGMPLLLLPSVQVNIRAGNMPPPESDGNVYLKLPVNRL